MKTKCRKCGQEPKQLVRNKVGKKIISILVCRCGYTIKEVRCPKKARKGK